MPHLFKMSKTPFHYVMSTLQLRFNCIQQVISTYIKTLITYKQYSTVFSLTKSEERLENLSKQLHHVLRRLCPFLKG